VPPSSAPPVTGASPAASEALYAVWVASYKKEAQANVEIRSLRKRGYSGRAVQTDLGDKGIWYRVYAGSYPSKAEAAAARDVLLQLPEYKSFAQVRRLPRD
jgi:cell division septation protein DedD